MARTGGQGRVAELLEELVKEPATLSPAALDSFAEASEIRMQTRYSVLGFIIEPVVVVGTGFLLGFIILSLLAPMFTLLVALS